MHAYNMHRQKINNKLYSIQDKIRQDIIRLDSVGYDMTGQVQVQDIGIGTVQDPLLEVSVAMATVYRVLFPVSLPEYHCRRTLFYLASILIDMKYQMNLRLKQYTIHLCHFGRKLHKETGSIAGSLNGLFIKRSFHDGNVFTVQLYKCDACLICSTFYFQMFFEIKIKSFSRNFYLKSYGIATRKQI